VRRHDEAPPGTPSAPVAAEARRSVVRPGAAAQGAPDPRVATGETLRWGVVSTGHIARVVTAQLLELDDAELHAVSSRDAGRAEAFAREHGARVAYGDDSAASGVAHLASDPSVDVVYVATPHAYHHAIARTLLEAGKHVLVEKPFTVNAAEAADLVALARDRRRFLMEAVWTRFLPVYHSFVDHLADGAIGTPRWAQADLGMRVPFDAGSRLWARDAGGGALLDLAVYALAWTTAAFGLPRAIAAHGVLAENGVDALSALDLAYAGDARAQVTVSFMSAHSGTATVGGDAGIVRTWPELTNPPGFSVTRGEETREVRVATTAPGYTYQLRDVTRCIQRGALESETMPLHDTLTIMRRLDEARSRLGVRYPNDDAPPSRADR
jgi:predicted dehydrogenase